MAGKQVTGDGLSANLAGLSKNQLYDIMSQMKTLIEQNQQQARQILIQNPGLTKALFQAQIILGMVQPPQSTSSIQSTSSTLVEPQRTQATLSLPTQVGLHEETRKQQSTLVSSAPLPAIHVDPPGFSSHQLQPVNQPKGPTQMPPPVQSSQFTPNIHPLPHHSASQSPLHPHAPIFLGSNQMQQPIQPSGITQMPPRQPPLPQQPRPHMPFTHSGHPQMAPNLGFDHSRPPPLHHSQPAYHMGNKPTAIQGQPPYPMQPPTQSPYQPGGSHVGQEFGIAGSSSQVDRGSPWMPNLQENAPAPQHSAPPPPFPGHMGPAGAQPSQTPMLSRDMEKALLQQVMNLTPEQINALPPEQRNQVLQLRDMLLRQ